jgi:hypothetical protein
MDTFIGQLPELFRPHPNLSDAVNRNIIASEVEGGVHMDDLPEGATLEIETQNRSYRIVKRSREHVLISGHPRFCPDPILVRLDGSNWGGSMLKASYIGRGMFLEFQHPDFHTITTSRIIDIRAR